ncbi:hypothetical protein ABT095_03305 [Kitasatospora sp. NPDC002227]|uniref:hypothetical protein n=1 Tax=Kitasatospora sp. NPDC002227 TaxID=3154773 RepID=UPI003332EAC0
MASGARLGWPGRLVCCLVPVLTLGMAGVVPSVVLAVRRRRPADVIWAVVFGLLQLGVYVALGLVPTEDHGNASVLAGFAVVTLWLLAPVHYLVLDLPRFWPQPKAEQVLAPGYGYPPYQAPAAYGPPLGYGPQAAAQTPAAPAPATPAAAAPGPARAGDDLQQLGELLRRQVREGGPQ